MSTINQSDIADFLNLSRATVTKALQDHPAIALETKRKVKRAAREMGYLPNRVGRSLSTKKTNTLGVVVPKIAHSFFSSAIESMYEAAARRGYQIILTVSFENGRQERANIETLLSMNVDGLIIDSSSEDLDVDTYQLIQKRKTPFLFFDRQPTAWSDSPGIVMNDFRGAYEATQFLINKGYTQLGMLAGPSFLNVCQNRLAGFRSALQDHNLEVPSDWIVPVTLTVESGYQQFASWVKRSRSIPEAILCVNDSTAHGVYQAASELAMNIPEDMGIVGFGDLLTSRLLHPPLTTVRLPIEEMSKAAIDNLVQQIEQPDYSMAKKVFAGELVIRGSA